MPGTLEPETAKTNLRQMGQLGEPKTNLCQMGGTTVGKLAPDGSTYNQFKIGLYVFMTGF